MKKYQNILDSAVKYLAEGLKKNFVVHTEGMVKAKDIFLKQMKQRKNEFENV